LVLTLVGCGQGGNAAISGKVTFNGAPVTGGSLLFVPNDVAGKPAEASVGQDGAFRSSPATAGKQTVTYNPPTNPTPPDLQPGESAPPGPFDGLVPKQPEVEIKSGSNTLDIELVKPEPPAA
jgi:hypothetical protein